MTNAGNIAITGTCAIGNNTTITGSLTINTGNVLVAVNETIQGKAILQGPIINTQAGMGTPIDVSALTTAQSVSGLSFLPLSWAAYNPLDTSHDTEIITLAAGTDVGQEIELWIYAISTSSPAASMTLDKTRFDATLVPDNIVFSNKGEYIRCSWNGANWCIIGCHPRIYTNNATLK